MKLAAKLLKKYNTFDNPSDDELKYLYCLYHVYDVIGRKLPDTSIVNYYCVQKLYSIGNTLSARNVNYYNLRDFITAIKFIEAFEEKNNDK